MTPATLHLLGLGLVTDAYESIGTATNATLPSYQVLDPTSVAQHDTLAQLCLRALHQAWTMAAMDAHNPERVGLLFISAWGTIDSTVAYLESMLDTEGKYASPRHFSRSVYSSPASTAAIHFGIKGPCETLGFDVGVVEGALRQAWRLLQIDRCDRVAVVWAEQYASVAADLARVAEEKLGKSVYRPYGERGLGFGAIAAIVEKVDKKCREMIVKVTQATHDEHISGVKRLANQKPFAMDAALKWALKVAPSIRNLP